MTVEDDAAVDTLRVTKRPKAANHTSRSIYEYGESMGVAPAPVPASGAVDEGARTDEARAAAAAPHGTLLNGDYIISDKLHLGLALVPKVMCLSSTGRRSSRRCARRCVWRACLWSRAASSSPSRTRGHQGHYGGATHGRRRAGPRSRAAARWRAGAPVTAAPRRTGLS
jgi:hypothetical protein